MNRNNKGRINNIIFGLAITLIAINMLLSSLDLIDFNIFTITVSVIAVGYGLYALITKNFFLGVYGVFFGLKFSSEYFRHIVDLKPLNYWSLFFIGTILALGLELMFGGFRKKKYSYTIDSEHGEYTDHLDEDRENTESEYIFYRTSLTEDTRYVYSKNLAEVNLEVTMGSMKVFFQERELSNDLTINTNCRLGNLSLFIPKEWQVVDAVGVTLGQFDLEYNYYDIEKSPYKVYISGNVSLGNIEIHYI